MGDCRAGQLEQAGSHPGEIPQRAKTHHPLACDSGAMNESITYEIVIGGHASERMLGAFRDDFAIEVTDAGTTRMTGAIRDAAHLHGVVTHLTSLAIDIVSLAPLEPDAP